MQASCDGNQQAFEQLVLRHEAPLYRFMLARLGNVADAQDVLQEAFAAAWRYRQTYRSTWRFSTWLYRIALRHGQRRRHNNSAAVDPDAIAGVLVPGPLPGQADIWDHAREHLSATAFSIIWLHYHEQWKLAEIATCVDRPVSWVKVTLFRARRKLAVALKRDHYGV